MPPAGLPAVAFGGTREPFEKGSLDSPKLLMSLREGYRMQKDFFYIKHFAEGDTGSLRPSALSRQRRNHPTIAAKGGIKSCLYPNSQQNAARRIRH